MRNLFVIILLTFVMAACGSISKSFENADYDKVISTVIKNINTNKKVTDEDLRYLEDAYNRILEKDLSQIERMKSAQNPALWVDIFSRYKLVMNRQEAILQVTPIFYQDGDLLKVPEYDFIPVLEEARQNASEYHYQEAKRLLTSSSKKDARAAFDHLDCIFYYYTDYKDAAQLLKTAREKGITHVLLSVERNPYLFLPEGFENELFNYDYQRSFGEWTEIYTDPYSRSRFDLNVKLVISNSQISPGVIKESSYIDEKKIEDGWQYEYDNRGNVRKDSLGNDIKRIKYKTITAQITESLMQREAIIEGVVEIYDYNQQRVLKRDAAQGVSAFSAAFATYRGDRDALSATSLKKVRSPQTVFPSDLDMILPATEELKRQFRNILSANRRVIEL